MTDRTYNRHHLQQLVKHYSQFISPYIAHHSIDDQYSFLTNVIGDYQNDGRLSKHLKIRVKAWMDKLNKQNYDHVEMQNRNNYLKLLHLMLQFQQITSPFDIFPGNQIIVMKKQEYLHIITNLQRNSIRSRECSNKNSKWVSPSTSIIRKEFHGEYDSCSTYKRKQSRNSIALKKQKIKTPTSQPSTNYLARYKSGVLSDEIDDKTVQDQNFTKKDNYLEHPFQQVQIERPSVSKNADTYEYEQNFNEIVGFKMSNFVSKRLKTFIQNNSHSKKKKERDQLLEDRIKQSDCKKYSSVKKGENSLNLSILNKQEERYWQINSYNQNNTPKYLNIYQTNPYPSLQLSEQNSQSSQISSRICQCQCSIFNRAIVK